MFQHPGAGQHALLGHVTDEHDSGVQLPRQTYGRGGHGPHLGDAAGSRVQVRREHGLHAVDDDQRRLQLPRLFQPFADVRGGQQVQLVFQAVQPFGPEPDLLRALLAADIEHPAVAGYAGRGLQQQGGFADARLPAQQHGAAGDEAAAQHRVQLFDAGEQALLFGGDDLAYGPGRRPAQVHPAREHALGLLGHLFFDQGVPGAAMRAFAHPAHALASALAAEIYGLRFSHMNSLRRLSFPPSLPFPFSVRPPPHTGGWCRRRRSCPPEWPR